MPGLDDENFSRSVSLICHHDDEGAMGAIINQPLTITLAELFADSGIPTEKLLHPEQPVWYGGPVRMDHIFVLHDSSSQWENTLKVNDNLCMTTSSDLIESLVRGHDHGKLLLALGYAGWGPGQLENEMQQNSWVYAEASNDIIFDTEPSLRWEAAAKLAGIDLARMALYSGKA